MRIAIYENLPPGGAKRASYELGRYLAQRHEVDLYRLTITNNRAFDLGPLVRRVYSYPFAPFRGSLDGRLKGGRYAPRSYILFGPLRRLHRRIAADIRSRRYDLVLAHTDAMTQSPYLLRWLDGVPTAYYCQEVLRIWHERSVQLAHRQRLAQTGFPIGMLRLMEDTLVQGRLADADAANTAAAQTVLVNSKYSREQVWSAYGRNAVVCYLGVDVDRFRPDPTVNRRFEVLSIGSPLLLKGHAMVIEALATIPPGRPRPSLRVVAGGQWDAEGLARMARQRGVILTIEGALDDSELVSRYRTAMMTVCAARLEPFGLTPLESMACATPVVAIEEAGYRESIVGGTTGLLVDPDSGAMARAIDALIAQPDWAASLGRAGRDWVTGQWTWDHAGRRLEAALMACATAGSGTRTSAGIDEPAS